LVLAALCGLVGATGSALVATAVALGPGVSLGLWATLAPATYERLWASPGRRLGWWWYARRRWAALARLCGLAERQVAGSRLTPSGPREVSRWVAPGLVGVHARTHAVELTVRARAGQTLAELETGAERLATTFGAVSHRVRPISGSTVVIELVMLDALATTRPASRLAALDSVDAVPVGRTQAGGDWWLRLRGRHTLVAGCSGAGKGSVLWGVAGGLAPAVHADLARLWGIDLKRGIELAIGAELFCTRADTPTQAVDVLRALLRVIDARGVAMAGRSRLHQPTRGDPLHVLVVDELAALTAYAEAEVRKEATRLLSEILTQGRALGVVVIACVQDPRKDVVSMRGLFTQTIALRLRSVEETVMVLGEGAARIAPAHRISPVAPGTA
jgi:S-DNA-T family DNA segregation ATPase FtsK/SpoIIIE